MRRWEEVLAVGTLLDFTADLRLDFIVDVLDFFCAVRAETLQNFVARERCVRSVEREGVDGSVWRRTGIFDE